MPRYQYNARDRSGAEHSGLIVADTEAGLREQLHTRNLLMTRCRVMSGLGARKGSAQPLFRRKVKLYDLMVMSRQLATLVRAGISVVEALDGVALQSESPVLVSALTQVRETVVTGSSMSEAMADHPHVFSEVYCALVAAGEAGGTLEETLEVAADQLDKQQALREQVKSAMLYPIIVIVAAVLVITIVLTVLVPVFQGVYAQFGHELPAITRFLLALSNIAVNWWFIALPGLAAVGLMLRAYVSTREGRRVYDSMKLKVWMFGPLFRKIGVAEFTQTFTGMIRGGVPMLGALEVSANTSSNVIIRSAIANAAEEVKEGSPLAVSLEQSGQFPPMVTRMIASGEKSGNLDEMLEELTKFYQRDIEHSVQRLARTMEPVMTVVVGGIVLFTLLALYMPVFMLSQVIKR